MGQLFPHSVFKSQTATVPHDSSRKPRPGRHWGSGGRVTRGLLALICVKNAVGQIFSRFNVSVCYSEVRGVRQLLVGVFFRKTGTKCKYRRAQISTIKRWGRQLTIQPHHWTETSILDDSAKPQINQLLLHPICDGTQTAW